MSERVSYNVKDPAFPDLLTVATVNFSTAASDHPSVVERDYSTVSGDREATVEKMTFQTREACRQGARLVVFPEGALGAAPGPCSDCELSVGPCDAHIAAAETVPGPSTKALARVASELNSYIIFGIDEADRDYPNRLYNAAAIVGPEGVLGTYRKLHLGPFERHRFTPGESLPVWETSIGPIGVLICYDFWANPELSRILSFKGARLLINPTRSADVPGKAEYVRNTTIVRAQENLIYALSSNWTGPIGAEGRGVGHSTIAGPAFPALNGVVAEGGSQEQIILGTLNFNQLSRWHEQFPWRDWRLDPQRQLAVTELIASEFKEIASDGASGGRDRVAAK